jgi:hypothetical protein
MSFSFSSAVWGASTLSGSYFFSNFFERALEAGLAVQALPDGQELVRKPGKVPTPSLKN